MTAQISDSIIWKRKRYELLGYDGDEENSTLFHPEKYGLSPKMMHTTCYRGYYCTYKIIRNSLFLDTLCVNDGSNNYPDINGITVNQDGTESPEYANIKLFIPFTGVLRIGADFKWEHYVHMGFQKPSAFGIVWDLKFGDGKISEIVDISEEVEKIEGQYQKEYFNRDIIDRIGDSFKRDLLLR